jgi:hypothetical protein
MSYTFAVDGASDCSDQLASAGGEYAELPCTVAFTLAAKRQ